MPFVEFLVYGKNLTVAQKKKLYSETASALKRVLGSSDNQVRIAIQEHPVQNYFDGVDVPRKDRI